MTNPQGHTQTERRRRWPWYLLGGFALLVLGVTAVLLGLAAYWSQVVESYVESEPRPVAQLTNAEVALEKLMTRWEPFQRAVLERRAVNPLSLSADDINTWLSASPSTRGRLYLQIQQDQLLANFSLPLEASGQEPLRGKYLNGVAKLKFDFQGGQLSLGVESAEAKGKQLPRWLLKRLPTNRALVALKSNPQVDRFLAGINAIEVINDRLVFEPELRE